MTMTQPAVRQPGTGKRVLWLGSTVIEVLLDGAATEGQLSVLRVEEAGQGQGAPPHTHTREDETIVVLDGTVAFSCGGTEATVGPGGAVYLPRDLRHTYRLVTPRASLLYVFTPAGFEHMFLEGGAPATATTVARPAAGPPSPEVIARLVALTGRYGCELAPPGDHA